MIRKIKKENPVGQDLHHYYMSIINSVPDVIYWIDNSCELKGCNINFVKLLGLKQTRDFTGTPYDQMSKFTQWSKERINAFRLDDMRVIFTQTEQHGVEEAPIYHKEDKAIYFLSARIPLLDENRKVTGLITVLTDITQQKELEQQLQKKPQKLSKIPVSHSIKGTKVLIVEDDVVAREVETAILTDLHCKVDIAESGDAALKLFSPGKYDIIFMDIGLQDTLGYMVAKKIRQAEENTNYHVPIIALTSYEADTVKYDCKDYFMDGVLSKPLGSEQVKQIIQYFIYHEDISVNGLRHC